MKHVPLNHVCVQVSIEFFKLVNFSYFPFMIVNFPFLSSNRPANPAYGVFISQLIRYARCCSHYIDSTAWHKTLVARLVSKSYRKNLLSNSFKTFHDRYNELVGKYTVDLLNLQQDAGLFHFNKQVTVELVIVAVQCILKITLQLHHYFPIIVYIGLQMLEMKKRYSKIIFYGKWGTPLCYSWTL